jgi:KipI family sensor histidine kinase inhibitor
MHSVEIISEDTLLVRFHEDLHVASAKVLALSKQIAEHYPHQTSDIVIAYKSLSITVDLTASYPQNIAHAVDVHIRSLQDAAAENNTQPIEIPCFYSQEVAPDLNRLATDCQLSVDDLIALHSKKTYYVFAIGFSPGFPYLGEVDNKIATPRLSKPRLRVPKGAVGIADNQTGIYTKASPGGWNIIGRCPIDLFDNSQLEKDSPISLLQTGDRVIFKSIDRSTYISLGGDFE